MTTTSTTEPSAVHPAAPQPSAEQPSAAQLDALFQAFRVMQLEHNRVMTRESAVLAMGATDIRALFFIYELGDEATPRLVADLLGLSTGATTSLVDRLVQAGTLERQAHPTDRRSVNLRLTDAGHEAVKSVTEVYRSALLDVVPTGQFPEMTILFRSIADALAARSSGPQNAA